jgi:3,4-dihydroxy 2-butanone 4-phosphate synthase/GTP cyclohydrolase II
LRVLREGRFVVIPDPDPLRPCLLAASAERLTVSTLNTMVTLGHSLLSVGLPLADYARLGLPMISPVEAGERPFAAFRMVEAASGVTTGISVLDRLATIRAAGAASGEGALRQPGHVFIAPTADAGVVRLAGPREAACDLMRYASLSPASALSPAFDTSGAPRLSREAALVAEETGAPVVLVTDVIEAWFRGAIGAAA